jgi:hypothetical protein
MRQWMLRITAFAERLLDELDELDWPEGIKLLQRNWIGRSEGAEIDFKIENVERPSAFSRRGPTRFTARHYMVLAPEHPLGRSIVTEEQWPACANIASAPRAKVIWSAPIWRKKKPACSPARTRSIRQPTKRFHLDRRLRAAGLRDRRDHGRAGARRTRSGIRAKIRSADCRRRSANRR